MLNLKNDNGTIIKIDAAKSFLDIKEAFVFGDEIVGKVVFQFRSYDKNRPKGQRITQKVDFYMDLEDASYFAEIMKTGRIKTMCSEAKSQAQSGGKSTAYAFGYCKFGGTASSKLSRQLKFQLSDDGRLWVKALEGPGIVEDKGQIKPSYKDAEAPNKIAMVLSEEQTKKIGLALERAIRYFDTWNALGTLKEEVSKFHAKSERSIEKDTGFYPDPIPEDDFSPYIPQDYSMSNTRNAEAFF